MADREVFVNKVTVPSSSGTITAKLVDSVSGYTKYNYFEIPISYDSANQRYYITGITWQNIIDAYNRGDYIYGKYGNNIYVMTYYIHNAQETFLKLENFTTGQNSITTDGFTVEDLTNLVRHTSDVSAGGGTVTSVGISNATDGGLTISGSPVTSSGTITVGHTNKLASAQTTQKYYPITFDKNGHITGWSQGVTSVNPYYVNMASSLNWSEMLQAYNEGRDIIAYDEYDDNCYNFYKLSSLNISSGAGTSSDDYAFFTNLIVDGSANRISADGMSWTGNGVGWEYQNADITGFDVVSTYSSTGTDAVNGQAVNAALQTLDSSISATSGQAISAVTITDGKITSSSKISVGETNQNAFSNVKVGNTTIAADSKTDTLELVAGSNITLTPDATNDTITISSTGGGGGSYTATSPVDITNNVISLEDGYGDIQNPYGTKNAHYVLAGVSSQAVFNTYSDVTSQTSWGGVVVVAVEEPLAAGSYAFSTHINASTTSSSKTIQLFVYDNNFTTIAESTSLTGTASIDSDLSIAFTLSGSTNIYIAVYPDGGSSSNTWSATNNVLYETNSNSLPSFRALTADDLPAIGNIQNTGALQNTDVTITTGDKLVITDNSDSDKMARASLSFDTTNTTQYLRKDGTWATPSTGGGGSYTATSPIDITNNVISLEESYGDIQNPYGAKNEHYVLAGSSSAITYPDYTTPTTATTPDNYEIDDISLPSGTYTFSGHIQVPDTSGWSGGSVGVEVDGGSTQWGNFPSYEADDSVTFTLEAPADVILLVQSVNTEGFSSGTVSWTNLQLTSSNPARPEFRALTKEDLPSGLINAWYGTSITVATNSSKTVTCDDYYLNKGSIIGVLFSFGNTTSTPTLNVNNTGAKNIYIGNSTPNSTTNVLKWSTNTMVYFMYDGSNYRYITSVSAGNTASSRGANTWFGTSDTAAATGAKTSAIDNFVLTKGAVVCISFNYANTYAGALTLDINSTGSKRIYYNAIETSTTNTLLWDAREMLTFVYSGSYWYFAGKSLQSGGGGGSGGLLLVNFSSGATLGSYTADKTFAQIVSAVDSGSVVMGYYGGEYFSLTYFYEGDEQTDGDIRFERYSNNLMSMEWFGMDSQNQVSYGNERPWETYTDNAIGNAMAASY